MAHPARTTTWHVTTRERVVVVGGGALVPGFGKRLEDTFGFSALMADEPLTRVAEGGARCLGNKETLAAYAVS